jgi:hypothetical protein
LRKSAVILLLGVMLFNWFGYRLIISCMQNKADKEMEARLDDASYDPTSLISVKVPVTTLSYYTSSAQFERVDGSIEIGGIAYNYVMRRLYNDSLEVLCIPNRTAMQLKAFENEFLKSINGWRKPPIVDPYVTIKPLCCEKCPFRLAGKAFYHPAFIPTVLLRIEEKPPAAVVSLLPPIFC